MKIFNRSIFVCGLIVFIFCIGLNGANSRTDISGTTSVAKDDSAPSELVSSKLDIPQIDSPSTSVPNEKELVVVSKTPELFSYTLAGISLLLSVVTILIAFITGIGLVVIIRVSRDRKRLEDIKESFDKEQKDVLANLNQEYDKMIKAFKSTAFRLASFQEAKHNLRNILSDDNPSQKTVYLLIEKTVNVPDVECLRLYALALMKFETNIDIVRIVRSGILQFSRSPDEV